MLYIMTLKTAASVFGRWTNRFSFSFIVQGVAALTVVNINESVNKKQVFSVFKELIASSRSYSEHRHSLIAGVHIMKQGEHNML